MAFFDVLRVTNCNQLVVLIDQTVKSSMDLSALEVKVGVVRERLRVLKSYVEHLHAGVLNVEILEIDDSFFRRDRDLVL